MSEMCQRCGSMPRYVTHVCPPPQTIFPAPVARPPVKCPICLGRGTVAHDFYANLGVSTSTLPEKCRSCGGRGIV